MRTLLLASLLAACTPIAVTPPARTFMTDSPAAPAHGTDAQVAVGHTGQIFGPSIGTRGLRLRHSIEPGIVGEVDGGMLHVDNDGDGPDRNAYTGRLGLLVQTANQHAAFGVGLGGGMSPAAGNWTTIDAGVTVGGSWRYLRPVLGGWVGYSAPVGDHTFSVNYGDHERATLRLPHNVFGVVTAGLEIGPPTCAFLVGMTVVQFWLREDSVVQDGVARSTGSTDHTPDLDQSFVGGTLGFRLSL